MYLRVVTECCLKLAAVFVSRLLKSFQCSLQHFRCKFMGAGSVVLCSTGNGLQVSDYGSALSYPFQTLVPSQIINKQAIVLQSSDSNSLIVQGSSNITPQEFENGGYTLKTHQMFSDHTAAGIYKRSNHRSFWNCV